MLTYYYYYYYEIVDIYACTDLKWFFGCIISSKIKKKKNKTKKSVNNKKGWQKWIFVE